MVLNSRWHDSMPDRLFSAYSGPVVLASDDDVSDDEQGGGWAERADLLGRSIAGNENDGIAAGALKQPASRMTRSCSEITVIICKIFLLTIGSLVTLLLLAIRGSKPIENWLWHPGAPSMASRVSGLTPEQFLADPTAFDDASPASARSAVSDLEFAPPPLRSPGGRDTLLLTSPRGVPGSAVALPAAVPLEVDEMGDPVAEGDDPRSAANLAARAAFRRVPYAGPGSLDLRIDKVVPFDGMFEAFRDDGMNVEAAYTSTWRQYVDMARMSGEQTFDLARLSEYMRRAQAWTAAGTSNGLKHTYLSMIFGMFTRLNFLRQYGDEPGPETDRNPFIHKPTMDELRNYVSSTMEQIGQSFADGCDYNQISALRTILCDTVKLHKGLILYAGAASQEDFLFSLAIHEYHSGLIREGIRHAEAKYREGTLRCGHSPAEEEVELEFVVRKRIGLSQDNFENHYFTAPTDPAVAMVVQYFMEHNDPTRFLLEQLSAHYPSAEVRTFHTQIGMWLGHADRELDPFEVDKRLLLNPAIEEGDYSLWFREKTVAYFLVTCELARPKAPLSAARMAPYGPASRVPAATAPRV